MREPHSRGLACPMQAFRNTKMGGILTLPFPAAPAPLQFRSPPRNRGLVLSKWGPPRLGSEVTRPDSETPTLSPVSEGHFGGK
ncbi:hypothetical protein SKAU_G00101240 [Synaphobranchus kaupii]|uniref:Uncharacterized protein n=1 Tax=Synaphobranchus kaupii TaxID=118154 RepID=A0A9Q1J7F6_SYNKA|nr:hypothetical protein SKAU_G00101240 [Synaphobranchus kaupii]